MNEKQSYLIWLVVMVFICILLNLEVTESQTLEWKSVTPENFKERVLIEAYGTELIYYGLDASSTLTFKVKGPTQIRVLSRLRFPPGLSGEQSYEVTVLEDGVIKEKIDHRTTKSKKASYLEMADLRLGEAMHMDFVVEDTIRHTYEVRLSSHLGQRVEIRLFKLRDETEIIPLEHAGYVTAILSESRERMYYFINSEHPVRVRIKGPTRLKIQTRLDYGPAMVGKQIYSLTVSEDAKSLKTFHMESVRSSTVTYKERPEVIPGALNTIQIEVPAGTHVYEFQLPHAQFTGAALRFLMPTKNLW